MKEALQEFINSTPLYITPSQIDAFKKGFIAGQKSVNNTNKSE